MTVDNVNNAHTLPFIFKLKYLYEIFGDEYNIIQFKINVYLVPQIQGSNLFIYFALYRIYKPTQLFQVSIFCHAYLVQVHVSRRCHIIIKFQN